VSEIRTAAHITEQPNQAITDTGILDRHDRTRLLQLSSLISGAGRISLEGEPIYADQGWSHFHAFTHECVIPEMSDMLSHADQVLDVLYDDCTVASIPFSLEYYLERISQTRSDRLALRVNSESDVVERARDWVEQLDARGQTSRRNGITQLSNGREVNLTTQSGRPTCAVLDAVYQMQKAESGVDTAVLVHNTAFRGQQLDMQAVLQALDGTLPFDNFANIYIRQRKGALRLAAIQVLSAAAQLTEVK
jgi:hypothetical protein